ncbi:hypothetical protein [Microvirga tunisiensis]|uniref:Uncharacterized protein n=1 Tax=Microvirga tunisiensis TaxID=2108360 RepID=A0A5N7MEF2_9HYPH|nr:hypothetical protein [Microvirga tunisiensis]MPR06165.1 hypothetical protein [Microvirga tunisiensis]MPR25245.1 hypothetical protein [Microvirga tunisiensis]
MHFITFRTVPSSPSGGLLTILIRLALLAAAGIALLTMVLVGFFVVLPVMLIGGCASYFYLRRRIRRSRQHSHDGVIDAEYTIVDRQ